MTSDQKKFWRWFIERRKLMGLLLKQIADEADVHLMTMNRLKNGQNVNANNRNRIAKAMGYADWDDLSRHYLSGAKPGDSLPKPVRRDSFPAPARLAENLLRFAEDDAAKYRDQVFQNLTPKAVAEIAEIFTQRLARYAKGGS